MGIFLCLWQAEENQKHMKFLNFVVLVYKKFIVDET